MEVVTAAAKLQNHRACGPDSVPNELLKYACTSETTSQWVADLLNAAVEGSIHLSALGTGTLVALQKPNKPRGPLTSLRPVYSTNTPKVSSSTNSRCTTRDANGETRQTIQVLTKHIKNRHGQGGAQYDMNQYENMKGLEELHKHAADKHQWEETIEHICSA